jgi:hypothetical protein
MAAALQQVHLQQSTEYWYCQCHSRENFHERRCKRRGAILWGGFVGVFAETQISGRLRGIGEAGVGVQYSASSESILLGSRKQSSRSGESSEGVALAALFNLQAHLVLPFVVQRLSMPVILDLLLLSKGICGLPLTYPGGDPEFSGGSTSGPAFGTRSTKVTNNKQKKNSSKRIRQENRAQLTECRYPVLYCTANTEPEVPEDPNSTAQYHTCSKVNFTAGVHI